MSHEKPSTNGAADLFEGSGDSEKKEGAAAQVKHEGPSPLVQAPQNFPGSPLQERLSILAETKRRSEDDERRDLLNRLWADVCAFGASPTQDMPESPATQRTMFGSATDSRPRTDIPPLSVDEVQALLRSPAVAVLFQPRLRRTRVTEAGATLAEEVRSALAPQTQPQQAPHEAPDSSVRPAPPGPSAEGREASLLDVGAGRPVKPDLDFLNGAGSGPEGEPLPGTPFEVVIQLRDLLRDRRSAVAHYRSTIPATLRRLEDVGTDRIGIADVVIEALRRRPESLDSLAERLAPSIRSYLIPVERHEADWYKTLGSLADVLHQGGFRGLLGVVYYDEILFAIKTAWSNSTPRREAVDAELWEVVEANANNLAADVARALQHHRGGMTADPLVVRRHLRDLVQISAAASVAVMPSSDEASSLSVIPRWNELRPQGLPWRTFLELAGRLGFSSLGADSVEEAYIVSLGAVARAALRSADRTAAAFFNAGVTLARLRPSSPDNAAARVLLNGLGAGWALRLNDSLAAAMTDGDGLDCLVNLFGAAATMGKVPSELKVALQKLASLTDAALRLEPGLAGVGGPDRARLSASFEKLNLEFEAANPGPTRLSRDLDDALAQVNLEVSGLLQLDIGERADPVAETAAAVTELFEKALSPAPGAKERLVGLVTETVSGLAEAARDPVKAVLDYEALRGTGGFLVKTGVVTAAEWRDRLEGASRRPCESLVAAYSEALRVPLRARDTTRFEDVAIVELNSVRRALGSPEATRAAVEKAARALLPLEATSARNEVAGWVLSTVQLIGMPEVSRRIAPAARGYIGSTGTEPQQLRVVGGVGDLMIGIDEPLLALASYHDVLRRCRGVEGADLTPAHAELIHIQAHNAASTLERQKRLVRSDKNIPAVQRLYGDLSIAARVGEAALVHPPPITLGDTRLESDEIAALAEMGSLPFVFRGSTLEAGVDAYLAVLAGILQVAHTQGHRAIGLHNLAVSVEVQPTTARSKQVTALFSLAAALDAVGRNDTEIADALPEVLAATVASLNAIRGLPGINQALQSLVGSIRAQPNLSAGRNRPARRALLEEALRLAGGSDAAGGGGSLPSVLSTLHALVSQSLGLTPVDEDAPPEVLAVWLERAWAQSLADPSRVRELRRRAQEQVKDVLRRCGHLRSALQRCVDEIDKDGGPGPAAGITSRAEWDQLESLATEPCESLLGRLIELVEANPSR
jgi:hypothetical protein